jgi:SAM-dependent methyltransferase
MGWLSCRRRRPEIMEQADLDPRHHVGALRGLSRVNFWSHSAGILWPELKALAITQKPRPVRVLDLASGAGDIPIRLWQRAHRSGFALEVEGWDISPVAVEHARASASRASAEVRFTVRDVLAGDPPSGYDVVMASLFLHHQDDATAVVLLRRMAAIAGRLVLINDLLRCWPGLLLAHAACRVLTLSHVVHNDGPRSVEAGFTREEAQALAEQAGLHGATVSWRWPFRFLLVWKRPPLM